MEQVRKQGRPSMYEKGGPVPSRTPPSQGQSQSQASTAGGGGGGGHAYPYEYQQGHPPAAAMHMHYLPSATGPDRHDIVSELLTHTFTKLVERGTLDIRQTAYLLYVQS